MAESGQIIKYDDYYEPKDNSTRNRVVGGTIAGAYGTSRLMGAKNVGERAAADVARANLASQGAQESLKATKARTKKLIATQQTANPWVRIPNKRKAKKAAYELQQAQERATKSRIHASNAAAANTPGMIASKQRNARILGATLLAGGAATAVSPLFRRKKEPAVAVVKAEVSKTITQARYGGVVEAGRAWRGPEKKDRKTRDVALASGAVGLGGAGAAAVGQRRLRKIGPLADIKGLESAYTNAVYATRAPRIASAKRLRGVGAGIGAAGGLAALAAGIKAEKERRPHAAVRKALPLALPLRVGFAATKMLTPKPVRSVVRQGKVGWDQGMIRAAENQAYKQAGMKAPKPIWAR